MTDPSLFSVSNVVGLEKPLVKLIETVRAGVGTLYEPRRIRREGQAKAETTLTRARADADALIVHQKAQIKADSLAQRALERLTGQELRRQTNIEAILEKAAKALPTRVDDEPVKPDWTSRFFSLCQDISDDDIQSLWARVLAGEVEHPGSFSLRTLLTITTVDRFEAALFAQACSYCFQIPEPGGIFVPNLDRLDSFYKSRGFDYAYLLHMIDIGLFSDPCNLTLDKCERTKLIYCGAEIEFVPNEFTSEFSFAIYPFSRIGDELFPITTATPDPEFQTLALQSIAEETDYSYTVETEEAAPGTE